MKKKQFSQEFPKYFFYLTVFGLIFLFGFFSHNLNFFPAPFIENNLKPAIKKLLTSFDDMKNTRFQRIVRVTQAPEPIINKSKLYPAPTLLFTIKDKGVLAIQMVDEDGQVFQEWATKWSDLFPTEESQKHIPKDDRTTTLPKEHVHDVILLENGDVIFETLGGLFRMNPCGEIVWRHNTNSINTLHQDEDGDIWFVSSKYLDGSVPGFPPIEPGARDQIITKITPDGKVLASYDFFEILRDNKLLGWLTGTKMNLSPFIREDVVHLADIEIFPNSMQEGFFKHGDIVLSARNLNAIFIFDKNFKIKKIDLGGYVRQNDIDFIDGDTLSIFNNNAIREDNKGSSHIVIKNIVTGDTKTLFSQKRQNLFYTFAMGAHQRLANGNLLITESLQGRVFEITPAGKIVWEHFNPLKKKVLGIIDKAQKVDPKFSKDFFLEKKKSCETKSSI